MVRTYLQFRILEISHWNFGHETRHRDAPPVRPMHKRGSGHALWWAPGCSALDVKAQDVPSEVDYRSIFLSYYLSIFRSIYLPVYLSICLSIYRSIYLFIDVSTYRSIDLSAYLPIYRLMDLLWCSFCLVLSFPILAYLVPNLSFVHILIDSQSDMFCLRYSQYFVDRANKLTHKRNCCNEKTNLKKTSVSNIFWVDAVMAL